ncbi:helix-turn-helix domain-containing protein [Streptococcus suis]|uniref:helix-turn-helix domain-containing protein n=1 Tax=Streptococcus suis TaxID=1307 RepID=UPI00094389D6|nr:helix-turn-helix domain-containing protein [Streptococcus suis]WNF74390.1 helix-turn-helix domain-containing protein [Streptococcus suis]HEL1667229.1 helix-turn-helix transcriptional regulator [Streptococcus suis]HEM2533503.1 helix-turn-helix transcriptional regulator [Streptococcus suis]HEM2551851.1 helix-turn-helix transcriptional regulator [Streptococcus suis]HEM2558017.1 helix-turn-helix transcriptional regulator [Streptococcus suis]
MKVFAGAKMRALRKDAGLTQYDLAPMVGISQNRVSDIERNVTTPTIDEIDAFADALKTQVSSFLSDETDIVVVENTFTKRKKDIDHTGQDNGIKSDNQSEQLELFVDDNLTGQDLTGYILVRADIYEQLLENQQRLQQLQSLLK